MLPDSPAPDDLDDHPDAEAEEEGAAREAKAALSPHLSGKQRRFLRAKGHLLAAVLQIGKEGITDPLVKNARAQLQAHELIKVKVGEGSPQSRHRAAEELARRTESELAQVLGRTFLLYRARTEKPLLKLPK